MVAPYTTLDLGCQRGQDIPVEHRAPQEVKGAQEIQWAPDLSNAYNPAFDVTPANLVTAFVLDQGVYRMSNKADYFS